MTGLANWVAAHAELVVFVALSVLSLFARSIESRSPRAAAALRALAVDVPGFVRAVRPADALAKAEPTKADEPAKAAEPPSAPKEAPTVAPAADAPKPAAKRGRKPKAKP